MRTFSILTLGCKVNQYESHQIRQFLQEFGLTLVNPQEKPDLFVINTCCVTSTASAKSRHYIQKAGKLNKDAICIITGCLAEIQTDELCSTTHDTAHLFVNHNDLALKIRQILGGGLGRHSNVKNSLSINMVLPSNSKTPICQSPDNIETSNLPTLPLLTSFGTQTRAFLKVQDGCDGFCSYCIIPRVRPVVRSKPIEDVIIEAKSLVSAGHKEIVVTGVNMGAYGRSTTRKTNEIFNFQFSIFNLLKELAGVEGLKRIRVSSLEPGDISEQLLDVFCSHPNIMPHIHLSVQSGSEAVLKRMCRPYSAEELRGKIELIKRRLDRPAITCDIIVGFPGETEENFQETVELAKWAGFSKMHIFPFSARAGTAGAKMKDKVPSKVAKERAEIMRNLGDDLGRKFREQFVGEMCEVLLEDTEPASGRCERYFIVKVTKDCRLSIANCQLKKNEIVRVKIAAVDATGTMGEKIKG